jgi:hypothetical protein
MPSGVKSCPGTRLAQPGGPTARVSVLPFYLKTEEDLASKTLSILNFIEI